MGPPVSRTCCLCVFVCVFFFGGGVGRGNPSRSQSQHLWCRWQGYPLSEGHLSGCILATTLCAIADVWLLRAIHCPRAVRTPSGQQGRSGGSARSTAPTSPSAAAPPTAQDPWGWRSLRGSGLPSKNRLSWPLPRHICGMAYQSCGPWPSPSPPPSSGELDGALLWPMGFESTPRPCRARGTERARAPAWAGEVGSGRAAARTMGTGGLMGGSRQAGAPSRAGAMCSGCRCCCWGSPGGLQHPYPESSTLLGSRTTALSEQQLVLFLQLLEPCPTMPLIRVPQPPCQNNARCCFVTFWDTLFSQGQGVLPTPRKYLWKRQFVCHCHCDCDCACGYERPKDMCAWAHMAYTVGRARVCENRGRPTDSGSAPSFGMQKHYG